VDIVSAIFSRRNSEVFSMPEKDLAQPHVACL
jgi:hypothetical protein